MAKPRLTQRQQALQKKRQASRVLRASRPMKTQSIDEEALGPEQSGLLIAHHGANLVVENENGTLFKCSQRQNLPQLVVGDRVIWRANKDGTGVVVAQLERLSELGRPDSKGHIKLMAANVNQLVIIVAASPPPLATTLDRYLVAAHWYQLKPLIVFNKYDLISHDEDHVEDQALFERIQSYSTLGYPLLILSCKQNKGIAHLKNALKNQTSIFVGQSGVGKSSLISALIPDSLIQIGAISEATGKGRHTTSTAMLYHLPDSGHVIDSPGIREFGLGHLTRPMLEKGFKEFYPFIGQCKFKDCRHQHEPDCALKAAVSRGDILPWRFAHYDWLAKDLII